VFAAGTVEGFPVVPIAVDGAEMALSTIPSRGRVTLGVAMVAVVVGAMALAGCGARMDVPITRMETVGIDRTRTTPARGTTPELPQRTLPISIWLPTGPGPWPLVVFAHGFNTTPDDYASLLEAWARAGYVVAAPTFPIGSSAGDGPPRRDDNWEEPWDMSWTINTVLADPAVAPKVDASKIGVAGHSDGGSAVAAMALNDVVRDGRVSAFLAMSGGVMTDGPFAAAPGGNWGAFNQGALLAVSGDADPNYPWARQVADWANEPKGIETLLGAGHFDPFVDGGDMGDTVRHTTVDFFNRWLRGDGPAGWWLGRDGNSEGLTRLDNWGL
jgi:dienelactone hydrolase